MGTPKTAVLDRIRAAAKKMWGHKAFLTLLFLFIAGGGLIAVSFLPTLPTIWSHLVSELGRALCASTVVAFAYEFYLRRSFFSIIEAQGRALAGQLVPLVGQTSSLGIVAVYPNRQQIPWLDLISNARTGGIAILGTSLGYWANIPRMKDAIQIAKQNNCEIRLLALDPKTDFAKERGREIGVFGTDDPEKRFCEDIEGSISFFKNLGCEVRTYAARPPFVIAMIEGRLLCSLLKNKVRGRDSIHIEFNTSSEWPKSLTEYFEDTWKDAASRS